MLFCLDSYFSRFYALLGLEIDMNMPFLKRVISIRDELSSSGFITPNVSHGHKERSSSTAEHPDCTTNSPAVNATGIVTGVNKIECNFPSHVSVIVGFLIERSYSISILIANHGL